MTTPTPETPESIKAQRDEMLVEVERLRTELKYIANANPKNWDAPYNDTATFQMWAQSRARAALTQQTKE